MSPEQLTKYILYCEWLIYATWRLVDNLTSLLQSVGASERLFQWIDLLPSSQFSCEGVKLQQLRGDIEFVDISFCYPTRVQGSGKSTLVKLLLHLFDPTDGEILVDGHPLKDLDIRGLRRGVGYVGQEPHLFNIDVKSNITYGCHRDVRWEDVEWAATLAFVHDFITSLPQGYDTLVDDDLLSGGQKQRIAIARAILRSPAILILDEATNALDAESERCITEVLHALRAHHKTRTIILIAQRLSTVQIADRIFVMDNGQIVEMGNHKELLEKDGLYARLVRLQGQILT